MDNFLSGETIRRIWDYPAQQIEQRRSSGSPERNSKSSWFWTSLSDDEQSHNQSPSSSSNANTFPSTNRDSFSAPSSLEPKNDTKVEQCINVTPKKQVPFSFRKNSRKLSKTTSNRSPRMTHTDQVSSEPSLNDAKDKVRSMWNNMKYKYDGWSVSTNFEQESPIFLLGKFYHYKFDKSSDSSWNSISAFDNDYHDFQADFRTRIWFTYRRGFEKLEGSDRQTDCGWGCMLRSGQMMLAQALVLHRLGRNWTRFAPQTEDEERSHRQIIRYFGDSPDCPLSVHRLVTLGQCLHDKSLGQWYGPASVALLLRDTLRNGPALDDPILSQIQVYVAKDCIVSLDEIDRLCGVENEPSIKSSDTIPSASTWNKSLVLIVPLRLGTDKINGVYANHVKTLFSLPNCLGIIGGRPKHSLYFVGWQKESLIYLDPHKCRDVVDMTKEHFNVKTFHSDDPRKLHFSDMDPSCAVGFYSRTKAEFFELLNNLETVIEYSGFVGAAYGSSPNGQKFPLFSVVQSIPVNNHIYERSRIDGKTSFSSDQQSFQAMQHGFELL